MKDGFLPGWATTPDLDVVRHVIAPGAFDRSIRSRGLSGPRGVKLLLDHDSGKPAGAINVLEMRGQKLWIEAQLDLGITYAMDRWRALKASGGHSFSVGFLPLDYEIAKDARGDEFILITRGDLHEVSAVVFPANEEAAMVFRSAPPPADIDALAARMAQLKRSVDAYCSQNLRRAA